MNSNLATLIEGKPEISPIDAYIKIYQASLDLGLVPLYCTIPTEEIDKLRTSSHFHKERLQRALVLLGNAITERLAPGLKAKVSEKRSGIYIISIDNYEYDVSHNIEQWLDDLSDEVLSERYDFHSTVPARFAGEIYHQAIRDAA